MKIAFLALVVVALAGCGLVDAIVGVDSEGNSTGPAAPGEALGGAVDRFLPGSKWIVVGLAGLWAHLRGRRYKKALGSVVSGVGDYLDREPTTGLRDELKARQDADGTRSTVRRILGKG